MLVGLTFALALFLAQSESSPVQQPASAPITGFVYCSEPNQTSAPLFLDACNKLRVGNVTCGQKLKITERNTGYLKVVPADGFERYMTENSLSQSSEQFVAFGQEVPASKDPECKVVKGAKHQAPAAIYSPAPDYSEKARKKGLQGTVTLSLVVDAEGVPRNVHVTKSLGMGLDEEAVKAVQNWRFKPGLENGKPVDIPITVEVDFRLGMQWHR